MERHASASRREAAGEESDPPGACPAGLPALRGGTEEGRRKSPVPGVEAHELRLPDGRMVEVVGSPCARAGVTDRRKVYHSFRHGWKTAARAVMPEDHHDAITGHSNGSVGRSYGSMPLRVLAESMAKVRYASLDLTLQGTAAPKKRRG